MHLPWAPSPAHAPDTSCSINIPCISCPNPTFHVLTAVLYGSDASTQNSRSCAPPPIPCLYKHGHWPNPSTQLHTHLCPALMRFCALHPSSFQSNYEQVWTGATSARSSTLCRSLIQPSGTQQKGPGPNTQDHSGLIYPSPMAISSLAPPLSGLQAIV